MVKCNKYAESLGVRSGRLHWQYDIVVPRENEWDWQSGAREDRVPIDQPLWGRQLSPRDSLA